MVQAWPNTLALPAAERNGSGAGTCRSAAGRPYELHDLAAAYGLFSPIHHDLWGQEGGGFKYPVLKDDFVASATSRLVGNALYASGQDPTAIISRQEQLTCLNFVNSGIAMVPIGPH